MVVGVYAHQPYPQGQRRWTPHCRRSPPHLPPHRPTAPTAIVCFVRVWQRARQGEGAEYSVGHGVGVEADSAEEGCDLGVVLPQRVRALHQRLGRRPLLPPPPPRHRPSAEGARRRRGGRGPGRAG
eukprot:441144-Rhodomonas_salina.2